MLKCLSCVSKCKHRVSRNKHEGHEDKGGGGGWVILRDTKSDANEDEGGPQSLPGRGGKLETVEEHVTHPRLVQRWVTRGELCTDVLVKDGHGDHGLGCVQHVVHDDEEVAVHSLDWDKEKIDVIIKVR